MDPINTMKREMTRLKMNQIVFERQLRILLLKLGNNPEEPAKEEYEKMLDDANDNIDELNALSDEIAMEIQFVRRQRS